MADFLNQNQPLAEPEVEIIHQGFIHWIRNYKMIAAVGVGIFIIFGIFLLIFFKVWPQNINQPANLAKYVIPDNFEISCPLSDELCSSRIATKYKSDPALISKLPVGTQIKSIAPVIDSQQFVSPHGDNSLKGVRQTYSQQENCYTVTYTLPVDAIINTITYLPLPQNSIIATLGKQLFSLNLYQTNFIIQIQKMPFEKIATGSGALGKCTVDNLKIGNFGEYQQLKR